MLFFTDSGAVVLNPLSAITWYPLPGRPFSTTSSMSPLCSTNSLSVTCPPYGLDIIQMPPPGVMPINTLQVDFPL
ncbi:unnamed protein product [Laminaria digitata]